MIRLSSASAMLRLPLAQPAGRQSAGQHAMAGCVPVAYAAMSGHLAGPLAEVIGV